MEESFSLSDVLSYCESEKNVPDESEIDPHLGVVFHPTHEEAIQILEHKSLHRDYNFPAIFEANIYDYEPDELQGLGVIRSDGKFYFFCLLKPLDGSGERFNRSTKTGYWKVTGKKFTIKARVTHEEIGTKRTLVFYKRFPGGYEEKTNWVMHEYSANNNLQDLVVCKIKEKKEKVKNEKRKGRKEDKNQGISNKKEKKPAKKKVRISTSDDRNHTESPILTEQGSSSSIVSSFENDVRNYLLGSSSSSQGSNGNHRQSPVPPEQGFPSSSQGSNLLEQGSSSYSVSNIENDECNSLLGSSSSSQGSNGNHRQSLVLPEQGFSSSSQGSNLPEQGSSSYSVSSNENDVSNSLGIAWDLLALHSPNEFLQQTVFSPDVFFLHQLLAEETGQDTCMSGVTSTYMSGVTSTY